MSMIKMLLWGLMVMVVSSSCLSNGDGRTSILNRIEQETQLNKQERIKNCRIVDGVVYDFNKIVLAEKKRINIFTEINARDKTEYLNPKWQEAKTGMIELGYQIYDSLKKYRVLGEVVQVMQEGLVVNDSISGKTVLVKGYEPLIDKEHDSSGRWKGEKTGVYDFGLYKGEFQYGSETGGTKAIPVFYRAEELPRGLDIDTAKIKELPY